MPHAVKWEVNRSDSACKGRCSDNADAADKGSEDIVFLFVLLATPSHYGQVVACTSK